MTQIKQVLTIRLSDPCPLCNPRLPLFPRFTALLRWPVVMHHAEKSFWGWFSAQVLAVQQVTACISALRLCILCSYVHNRAGSSRAAAFRHAGGGRTLCGLLTTKLSMNMWADRAALLCNTCTGDRFRRWRKVWRNFSLLAVEAFGRRSATVESDRGHPILRCPCAALSWLPIAPLRKVESPTTRIHHPPKRSLTGD